VARVSPSQKRLFAVGSILRLLEIGATLVATIVMGRKKKNLVVSVPLGLGGRGGPMRRGGSGVVAPCGLPSQYLLLWLMAWVLGLGQMRCAQCSTRGISLGGLLGHHSCTLALDFGHFVLCCRCLARCFMSSTPCGILTCDLHLVTQTLSLVLS
jgi:hypothetical protein